MLRGREVTIPFSKFLGYYKGEDGNLVVNEKEAVTVRHIYSLFLEGLSLGAIATKLDEEGYPAPSCGSGVVNRDAAQDPHQ